jgi:aspartate aminotransferase
MTTTPALKTKLLSDRINRIEVSATMAVVAEAAKLREQGADLVDYGAGEPHFSTPQHIKDAAIAAINNNFTRYTAVGGITELREAIVKRHAADFGSNYNRDECIASTGGKLALFNAIQVLVDHGDEVILPIPYWVSFKDIIQYAGGVPVYVETEESNGFKLTPKMIEQAITPHTKALILNSPSNPSGAVVKPEDMRAIMRLCHERGIYVIADECYAYLDFSGAYISVGAYHETKEHAVIIGSLSKTYAMTGWRLGYALAPAPITKAMQKLQSQSTSNSTSVVQKAGVAALNGPQECVAQMRADYIRLRDRVLEGLAEIPGIRCVKPGGAFYVYPNISTFFGRKGINSPADVAQKLLHEAHVVTVPSEAFGTQEHIRISYATSRQELDKGLERMKKFFAAL